MITESLPREIAGGHVTAVGAFLNGELVGVCAWTETSDPLVWHSAVTAIAHGYQGRGYGGLLKDEQIERAFLAGVQSVRAIVHLDNHAMLRIYRRLGATTALDRGDPQRAYLICEVRLVE
jgi:RimJ/RimL family protein N-acetyltransferase